MSSQNSENLPAGLDSPCRRCHHSDTSTPPARVRSSRILRSNRKLNHDQDQENAFDGTPRKKIKIEDIFRASDAGCRTEEESGSRHTSHWLQMKLGDRCSLEERREKLRRYSMANEQDTVYIKQLKAKDEIIDKLQVHLSGLQAQNDGKGDDAQQVTKPADLLDLVGQLRTAVERNEQLETQVAELKTSEMKWRSDYNVLKYEMSSLKAEKDLCSEQAERRIARLENELLRLKEGNVRIVEKDMKNLRDINGDLKNKLQEKTDELKKAHKQAEDEAKKRLSLSEAMTDLIKSRPQMNARALFFMEEKFASLKQGHEVLRDSMTDTQEAMRRLVQATTIQIQEAVREKSHTDQDLSARYKREMALRKRYHNQLVELRGNIRVFCRVRPGRGGDDRCLTFDPHDEGLISLWHKGRTQKFEMDRVFNTSATQSEIFDEVRDLIRSVLDGFKVCLFAYGQTGSGKTFTMEGPTDNPGINQRALHFLYEQAQTSNWNYAISASVLEVYNEAIRDLLKPDPNEKLDVKLSSDGSLHVPGLTKVPIYSLEEANRVFQTGRENRAMAATNMNEHSSRSHCLVCIYVNGVNATTGDSSCGQLNLVDLAGSERVGKSQAEGPRLKEALNINKSLSSLGDVIHALKNKHSHVPYRNSKLTYLLQDSLSGDSKTLMILQVAPEETNASETACSLTFGQRVRSADLGASSRREEGQKSTPSSRPFHDSVTPQASPSSVVFGRHTPSRKPSQSAAKRQL